jgi:hypothetical protein
MEGLPDDVSEGTKFFVGLFCPSLDVLTVFIFLFWRNVPSYRRLGHLAALGGNHYKICKNISKQDAC